MLQVICRLNSSSLMSEREAVLKAGAVHWNWGTIYFRGKGELKEWHLLPDVWVLYEAGYVTCGMLFFGQEVGNFTLQGFKGEGGARHLSQIVYQQRRCFLLKYSA